MKFAGIILSDEWDDLKRRHLDAIERRIYSVQKKKSTGTLRTARKYEVFTDATAMTSTATLTHPDYERFLDMKKKYMGKRRGKGAFQNRDVFFKKKSGAIHNRIIWGKLNPLTFRLMHGLRTVVTDNVRKNFTSKTLPYNL